MSFHYIQIGKSWREGKMRPLCNGCVAMVSLQWLRCNWDILKACSIPSENVRKTLLFRRFQEDGTGVHNIFWSFARYLHNIFKVLQSGLKNLGTGLHRGWGRNGVFKVVHDLINCYIIDMIEIFLGAFSQINSNICCETSRSTS